MVSFFSGCLGPHATAALHWMGFPAVSANAASVAASTAGTFAVSASAAALAASAFAWNRT